MEEVLPSTLLTIGQAICTANVVSSQEIWQVVLETAQTQLRALPSQEERVVINSQPIAGAFTGEAGEPTYCFEAPTPVSTCPSSKKPQPMIPTSISNFADNDLGHTITQLFLTTCYDIFALAKCYEQAPWNIEHYLVSAQRRAIKRCNTLKKICQPITKDRGVEGSFTQEDDDDDLDEDYSNELPDIFDRSPPTFRRGPRGSVRADMTSVCESLPVYVKTAEETREIDDALNTSFVFEAFGDSEDKLQKSLRRRLIDALKPTELAVGSWVMREGDSGDGMYFIGRGAVEISRGGKQLKMLGKGDLVGELAVLHECTRSYSCRVSAENTLLYYLDRVSYQTLLRAKQSEILSVTHASDFRK